MHAPSLPRADRNNSRIRRAIAGVGVGLLLGPLALAGSADAQASEGVDRNARPAEVADRQRPDADRPDRERPNRDFEVLRMSCAVADAAEDDTRVHIGCRWRAAESEKVAGYQLWRIVDRGEREMVARGGLDLLGARDMVSAETKVVRYAVIAVNENGRRVGQSRVQRIVLADEDPADVARRARANRAGKQR